MKDYTMLFGTPQNLTARNMLARFSLLNSINDYVERNCVTQVSNS